MKKSKIEIELVESIVTTKRELDVANKNFEHAEGELIDYYAYQIKANKAKLDYLLKKVKEKGVTVDIVSELKLRVS